MQDLPTWTHFDEATSLVTEDDAVSSIPCGPDIGPIVESVKKFLDAGYDHLYFHQVGPDQDGFLDIWTKELQPALARSEEHTSELQSLMRNSYAVFCLKKKNRPSDQKQQKITT